jgi:hypothetical protein
MELDAAPASIPVTADRLPGLLLALLALLPEGRCGAPG